MAEIPKFALYGENDPQIEGEIQPRLDLRDWSELEEEEKRTALQELMNRNLVRADSDNILAAIFELNRVFLRKCPGKNLHKTTPTYFQGGSLKNGDELNEAAYHDFQRIFLHEKSEAMVFRMLTEYAKSCIDSDSYRLAENAENEGTKENHISNAFKKFDRFAISLNHIFEQFSVNVQFTRNGLVPKQDEKITEYIYEPTLKILADPKWKTVSDDLAQMFEDYREGNHPEVITKAHNAVHRFLQILVGEEGKSGKGEFGTLFKAAKKEGLIPIDYFSEPIIKAFQGFFPSERANKSTAKPAKKDATPSDALLMMNVVMVFLQHCLQHNK